MTKKVLAIVIAVVAVIVAGVLIYNCSNNSSGNDSTNINSSSSGGKADSSSGGNTDSSGGTGHKHSFVLEQPEEEYLFSEATCTQKAWYYYSCECGAKGTDIFQYGTVGHSFTNYVSDNNATCTDDGTKTATCDRCDETNTITDEGTRLEHSFTNYVTNTNGYKEAECDHSCGKVTVIIENGVTAIADKAFSNRSEIISVTIPDSVTSIGKEAFSFCDKLETVFYKGNAAQWSEISIDKYNNELTNAKRYYYSETEPKLNASGTAYDGDYWHYDTDGKTPVIWSKN